MEELELYNEIGKNIKNKRKELGITQEELAKLTNYSVSFIANIESITFQSFSIAALNNIAKALHTNMISLLPKVSNYEIIRKKLKCEHCKYETEIPIELSDFLKSIKEITHKKVRLTCPTCNKKIVI